PEQENHSPNYLLANYGSPSATLGYQAFQLSADFNIYHMATQIRGKKKFVADGIFYAELNEVLTRELAKDGYVGAEVMVTTTEEVVTKISKIEEASPAMGGGVGGEGEKGSTKTKQ
ncbi:unnamed protein product, partial [Brassica napus]